MGNAAFHGDQLYADLKPAIALLVSLLDDSIAKTRANAASKNLENISSVFQSENFVSNLIEMDMVAVHTSHFLPMSDHNFQNNFELIMAINKSL